MEKIRQPTPLGGLKPALTQDSHPTYMGRNGGKGKKGSIGTAILGNRAKYGLAEGQDVVRMARTHKAGPSGNTFKLTHTGPTRMSRKASGSASHDSPTYGIAGVSGSGGGGYGVGGI